MAAFFMMKKIALIYMGGTFGCIGEPLSPMPAADFLPKLHTTLPLELDVQCFVAPVIKDSSACCAADWLALAEQIQNLQQENFQHFVVLHGTDTLSYASAVLAHVFGHSVHLILTGSQYPLLDVQGNTVRDFTDARDNLYDALYAVQRVQAGVYLSFNHTCIHARTALKCHTTDLAAFSGQQSDLPLATQTQGLSVHHAHIEKAAQFNCLSLMLQPLEISQHIANLKQILNQAPHCLILQGFGTANFAVNAELIEILQQFKQQNCAVILTTQVPYGAVDQRYAVNAWVKDSQILFGHGLGHADLYAKALKMYLQYPQLSDWQLHWYDE